MPAFCESLFLYLDNYFGSYPLKTTNKAKITENQQKIAMHHTISMASLSKNVCSVLLDLQA